MRKLFIIVLASLLASVGMVSYAMNDSLISHQRELREVGQLLLAIQLLEAQIQFNDKKIASMQCGNFLPMHVGGFKEEVALKQLENIKLQERLYGLRFTLNLYIAKNK